MKTLHLFKKAYKYSTNHIEKSYKISINIFLLTIIIGIISFLLGMLLVWYTNYKTKEFYNNLYIKNIKNKRIFPIYSIIYYYVFMNPSDYYIKMNLIIPIILFFILYIIKLFIKKSFFSYFNNNLTNLTSQSIIFLIDYSYISFLSGLSVYLFLISYRCNNINSILNTINQFHSLTNKKLPQSSLSKKQEDILEDNINNDNINNDDNKNKIIKNLHEFNLYNRNYYNFLSILGPIQLHIVLYSSNLTSNESYNHYPHTIHLWYNNNMEIIKNDDEENDETKEKDNKLKEDNKSNPNLYSIINNFLNIDLNYFREDLINNEMFSEYFKSKNKIKFELGNGKIISNYKLKLIDLVNKKRNFIQLDYYGNLTVNLFYFYDKLDEHKEITKPTTKSKEFLIRRNSITDLKKVINRTSLKIAMKPIMYNELLHFIVKVPFQKILFQVGSSNGYLCAKPKESLIKHFVHSLHIGDHNSSSTSNNIAPSSSLSFDSGENLKVQVDAITSPIADYGNSKNEIVLSRNYASPINEEKMDFSYEINKVIECKIKIHKYSILNTNEKSFNTSASLKDESYKKVKKDSFWKNYWFKSKGRGTKSLPPPSIEHNERIEQEKSIKHLSLINPQEKYESNISPRKLGEFYQSLRDPNDNTLKNGDKIFIECDSNFLVIQQQWWPSFTSKEPRNSGAFIVERIEQVRPMWMKWRNSMSSGINKLAKNIKHRRFSFMGNPTDQKDISYDEDDEGNLEENDEENEEINYKRQEDNSPQDESKQIGNEDLHFIQGKENEDPTIYEGDWVRLRSLKYPQYALALTAIKADEENCYIGLQKVS